MPEVYKKTHQLELMQRHGFRLTHALGQNLLFDKNTIDAIVAAAELDQADSVLEAGPGTGALTAELAASAGSVTAVEIDKRMIPLLEESVGDLPPVQIVQADFLKYDLSLMPEDYVFVGNLPYYISTPIIMRLVESDKPPKRMVLMIQKELGERLLAGPGTKTYGAISVAVQYRFDAERVANVSRNVFIPRPDVDSVVLKLSRRDINSVRAKSEQAFRDVVRAGFAQRRKMLKNALENAGYGKEDIERTFAELGLDLRIRAEELAPEVFVLLSDLLGARG